MSKGYQAHQERVAIGQSFGRNLARRAKSKCELCGASGVSLRVWEAPPIPDEPDFDRCILICDTCTNNLERPKQAHPAYWHCLHESAWSEVTAVQATAVSILQQLAPTQPWATDLLDQLYLPPEVEEWLSNQ
jgi:protein PhnA